MKISKSQWAKLIINNAKLNGGEIDIETIIMITGKPKGYCKQRIKMVVDALSSRGVKIKCSALDPKKPVEKEEEKDEINRPINVLEFMQENFGEKFGRHIRKNPKLFLSYCRTELEKQGWKFYNIGVIKRLGKFYQSGKPVRLGKTTPIYGIFSCKNPEGRMCDLFYNSRVIAHKTFRTSCFITNNLHKLQNNDVEIAEWIEKKREEERKEQEEEEKLAYLLSEECHLIEKKQRAKRAVKKEKEFDSFMDDLASEF